MQNKIEFLNINANLPQNLIEKVKEIYISSFPAHERIDFDIFLRTNSSNYFTVNDNFTGFRTFAITITVAGESAGFLSLYKENQFVFVLYFAVAAELRNQNLGSEILAKIHNFFGKNAIFIYEIEFPIDEISRKRIKFYERNGCKLNDFGYKLPPLQANSEPFPMLIGSFPREISTVEFEQVKNILYKKIYNSQIY